MHGTGREPVVIVKSIQRQSLHHSTPPYHQPTRAQAVPAGEGGRGRGKRETEQAAVRAAGVQVATSANPGCDGV